MSYVKTPIELGLRTDCQGIYIETNSPRIEGMLGTGFLEFGIGDTRVDAEFSTIASRMRGHESSKNLGWQHYLLDSIPNPGYRDYVLHREIRQTFATQLQDPLTGKRNEVFRVSVDQRLIEEFVTTKDFEPIRVWLTTEIRRCAAKLNPDHEKQSVNLRDIQKSVINKVLSVLRLNGMTTNFVCELAARIGKTILFLSLANNMRKEFGHESMLVMAYGVGLSVKTSYSDELSKYNDFAGLQFIDAADTDAQAQYRQALIQNLMPIVFASLNPDAEEKYQWINQLTGTHIALLEETDFGTHTDSQVDKVTYLLANKTVTRVNASGTNIGRLAKAFGKNAVDEIISVPYCMVEQDASIPDVVTRRFYNMLFNSGINKLLQDFDKDLLPNITKILSKPLSQQKFITALFQDIFGYQPIYGFNISHCAGQDIQHAMLFVNISKAAMQQLAEVIEKSCPEHKVLILNGDHTDNKEAEGLTKEELVRLANGYYDGRDKLLVITNMMGTRSYSVSEIQACLFMQEGGDVYPYMQKYSRCLTPGNGKKFGHIFDFAFDQSKTRNTIMSVAVEAALLIRQQGKTYPDAVREVLNSVNIKDMVTGQWIDADEVIRQFEDNNKLLEIANAHTRITIEDLTDQEILAFGELAKRSANTKSEQSKIDQVVNSGKTYQSRKTTADGPKKNPLKIVVEKAIRMINGSATTVLALSNYQGESFLQCIDIIDGHAAMRQEFFELYGVGPDTIKRLADRLEIPTLDMIVRMSKYNDKQKHIENNALAILRDDSRLWREIFAHKPLQQFIAQPQCQRILIAAGGHGSEIDVLVELFGIAIIDKIVYNDKYSFMCNQIRRRYPSISVLQGNFLHLESCMKFDVVVGNPPFQEGSRTDAANKLWPHFVKKADTLSTGYVAMVTPTGWMQPTADIGKGTGKNAVSIYNDIFKNNNLQTANINSDYLRKTYFANVGSTFSYFIYSKESYSGLTRFITADGPVDFDITSTNGLPKITNALTLSIVKKMQGAPFDFIDQNHGHNGSESHVRDNKHSHRLYHTNAKGGKFIYGERSVYATTPKVIITTSGYYNPIYNNDTGFSNMCMAVICNGDQQGQITTQILSSKLYRFWVDMQKFSGFVPRNLVLQLPKLDTQRTWTDTDIFSHFKLTQDEISYIESYVK